MSFWSKFQGRQIWAWLALLVVWFVWGSTYLGIRFAVETIPPLLMAGFRFLTAGVLMLIVAVPRYATGSDRLTWRQFRAVLIVSLLLLVGGNGLLSVGEHVLDSGFAALLVATVPIWMVLINWLVTKSSISRSTVIALVLGTVGIVVLIGLPSAHVHLGAALLVVFSSVCWAAGSVYARSAPLPRHPLLLTALELAVGGVMLMIFGGASGELAQLHIADISARSIAGLLWLIIAGSIVAFTAYMYANAHLPNDMVATYAYVNPVVAVILGAAFGQERVTLNIVVGGAILVCSVVLIARSGRSVTFSKKSTEIQAIEVDSEMVDSLHIPNEG